MSLELKKRPSKKAIIVTSIIALLAIAGINGNSQNNSQETASKSPQAAQSQYVEGTTTTKAPVIETKTVTETDPIPYSKKTVNDPTLDSGRTSASTGVNGEKTITYEVTYTDGKETSRTKVAEQTTKQPVDEVTKIGTKTAPTALSCPNGTYINSAGNTVCSPYVSNSAPAGATAKCGDGTYSFSQSRRGTCSHHGGVSIWY